MIASVDERDIRAARESMTVVREAPGLFEVYSGTTSRYLVGILEEHCTCPAATYQAGKCKHLRRVEQELGVREVPDLPGRTDVEIMIDASAGRQEVSG